MNEVSNENRPSRSAASEATEQVARELARRSFERLADRDVQFFAGFVGSWAARNLTLSQLADLVEQLDGGFPEPPAPRPVELTEAGQ